MTIDDVSAITGEALFLIIKMSAPMLLVSLVVGLVVSIFQTVTSIQEATLTFVPKVVILFLTIMVLGHWIANGLTGYMQKLWSDFSIYIR